MGKIGYQTMKTDRLTDDLIESDLNELRIAAKKLASHAFKLGGGLGLGTTLFRFLAFLAAM